MKIPNSTKFNIYLFIAILTFGHAMSNTQNGEYKSEKDRMNASVTAVISAPAWPFYWSYKLFQWGRANKVVIK